MKFLRGQKYGLIWELSENTKESRVPKRFSKAADGGQISTLTITRKLNVAAPRYSLLSQTTAEVYPGPMVHMEGLQIQNLVEFKSFGGNRPIIKII
jgi:hypothetical protein